MLRAHWGARRRDLDSWREHVRRTCGRRRRRVREKVRLNIVVYRQTRQDPDNAYASVKNLLDALVKEGWLADDSADLLDLRVTERAEARKVNHRTEVIWVPAGPGAKDCGGPRSLRPPGAPGPADTARGSREGLAGGVRHSRRSRRSI